MASPTMESRTLSLIVVSALLGFLATVATVLRFYARSLSRMGYGLDDYLTIAGLVLAWGVCFSNIAGAVVAKVGTSKGLGTEGPAKGHPTDELAIKFGQYFYSLQILHTCAMPIIKAAVLVFYRRLFSISHGVKIAVNVMAVYVGAWFFSTILVTIFQCWPIQNNWGTTPEAYSHCMPNEKIFYEVSALTNMLSDAAILFIPIPVVLGMQMTSTRKLAVLGVLLSGVLVLIAGIARTVSFFLAPDIFNYQDNFPFLIWTSVEPTLALISACLPTFRPFLGNLSFVSKPISSITSIFATAHPAFGTGKTTNNGVTIKDSLPYSPIGGESRFDWGVRDRVTTSVSRTLTSPFKGKYNPLIGRSKSRMDGAGGSPNGAQPMKTIWEPQPLNKVVTTVEGGVAAGSGPSGMGGATGTPAAKAPKKFRVPAGVGTSGALKMGVGMGRNGGGGGPGAGPWMRLPDQDDNKNNNRNGNYPAPDPKNGVLVTQHFQQERTEWRPPPPRLQTSGFGFDRARSPLSALPRPASPQQLPQQQEQQQQYPQYQQQQQQQQQQRQQQQRQSWEGAPAEEGQEQGQGWGWQRPREDNSTSAAATPAPAPAPAPAANGAAPRKLPNWKSVRKPTRYNTVRREMPPLSFIGSSGVPELEEI